MQALLLVKRFTAAVTEHPTEGSLLSQHDTVSECLNMWLWEGKMEEFIEKGFYSLRMDK